MPLINFFQSANLNACCMWGTTFKDEGKIKIEYNELYQSFLKEIVKDVLRQKEKS